MRTRAFLVMLALAVAALPEEPVDLNAVHRIRTEAFENSTGYRGDGGTVFATSAGYPDPKYTDPPPAIVITPEHYNRVVRLLENKIPVTVSLDVDARFHPETPDSFNILAELPGGRKKAKW